MSSAERKRKRALRGQDGLVAAYRPYFGGEGRVIGLQGVVAFIAGLCEALLLVVVAKLAFSIGTEGSDTIEGVGPLDSLTLSTRNLFALGLGLALARALMQVIVAHLAAGLISRRMSILRAATFQDYSMASWAKQASMDEASVQDLLVRYVTKLISALVVLSVTFGTSFTLIALLGSAVLIDPLAAILVVVSGLLLFVALRPLSKLAKRYAELQVTAGRRYVQASLEAIGLSLEIRSFGVNDEVATRLAAATEAEVRPIYVNQFLQRMVTAVYQFFAVSMVLLGLFAVYVLVDRPLASLGAIVIILVRSMSQAANVQAAYHTAVETAPFARMLTVERAEMRASAPASGSVQPPDRSSLIFDDVSYSYVEDADGPLALDGVSFEIEAGEAIGVIGPSGSGKSTLIQLLMRLRQPTAGSYLIGGVDTQAIDERAWFDQIAFVPQDCQSLNATILENIRFFRPHLSDEVVIDAAKRAHLHDEIVAMPAGYETELGSRGGTLSGGQRQRLAIARALASRPQILVLDEPTSALDMRSEALVHETLTDLQGAVTLVIIAHRLSTLKTCDRIMVFGHGVLQAFGERAELEADNQFYREAIALSKLRS